MMEDLIQTGGEIPRSALCEIEARVWSVASNGYHNRLGPGLRRLFNCIMGS